MKPLIDVKQCRVCKMIKPLSEYHPNKSCKQGVVGTCRICCSFRIQAWYSDNRAVRQKDANKRNQQKKQKAVDFFGGKCLDCQRSYPNCVYQFHHIDPKEKDMNPSYALANSETKMWKELSKCVMLCANCHMIRHYNGKEGVNG